MAAKVYDLSSYLEEQPAKIKLGEKEYIIKDGFNDLLKIDALSNRRDELGSTEFVQEFLRISLGEDEANELISHNYRTKTYVKIMECIQETYGGDDTEQESGPQHSLV